MSLTRMVQGRLLTNPWILVRDGHPAAFRLYSRHYSCRHYTDGRRETYGPHMRYRIAGPGETMVLLTPDLQALFVWRRFRDKSGQKGVNCAVFRNESDRLSSDLILAAEEMAAMRWPPLRFYTYINPRKIRSTNPGYCFLMAGWKRAGRSKRGLIILEKLPTALSDDSRNARVFATCLMS